MSTLRFDGRTAIITGAGGNPSLGRAYAMLLAERGATVLVNDLGVGTDGEGRHSVSADRVVQEIVDAGGEAIADANSVADAASAQAIAQRALDAWGRIDILINNAAVTAIRLFDEFAPDEIKRMIDVHLMGTMWMSRAVLPAMRAARYGRIVNTSSPAMLGARYSSVYAAAKAGVVGFTRSLAIECWDDGVTVNAIMPSADTAAVDYLLDGIRGGTPTERDPRRRPELVAQLVALLAHERSAVSGKMLETVNGRVAELYYARTVGYEDPAMTLETLCEHLPVALDRTGAEEVPYDVTTRPYYTPRGRE